MLVIRKHLSDMKLLQLAISLLSAQEIYSIFHFDSYVPTKDLNPGPSFSFLIEAAIHRYFTK